MKKKIVSAILSLSLLFSVSFAKGTVLRFKADERMMTADGKVLTLDSPPVVISGRTLCPVRAVTENLGGSAEFDSSSSMVLLKCSGHEFRLTVGSMEAFFDGEIYALDSPPVIINSRTMLPLRFIAERLSLNVSYDAPSGAVTVYEDGAKVGFDFLLVPPFSGGPVAEINSGEPFFKDGEITEKSFERYSPLDSLSRAGVCVSSVGQDIMPVTARGEIGSVRPTGWHLAKYDIVDGKYLYNRCHLIGYQLTGENANERNLITGTRYLNVTGMLPYENETAEYVKRTGNHVMYRATPVFYGDNLLADGVYLEALSVEDGGAGVKFSVFCYNVQPGIVIDYKTGESRLDEESAKATPEEAAHKESLVLNTRSKKYHKPSCSAAGKIKAENRAEGMYDTSELESMGYTPCGICNP